MLRKLNTTTRHHMANTVLAFFCTNMDLKRAASAVVRAVRNPKLYGQAEKRNRDWFHDRRQGSKKSNMGVTDFVRSGVVLEEQHLLHVCLDRR